MQGCMKSGTGAFPPPGSTAGWKGCSTRTPPPAVAGRRIKIRYMTQPKARPPHFVLFGNQLDELAESYQRFLVNGLAPDFRPAGHADPHHAETRAKIPMRARRSGADFCWPRYIVAA